MAEKKSWRDYTQTASTQKTTSEKKTGSWRDYTSGDSAAKGNTHGSWLGYSSINDIVKTAGENILGHVNNWLTSHNSYITDYQKRYEGRKYSYEDAYVSDSADWLNTITQKKTTLDTEADQILSYLDQYSGYLDEKWVNEVKKTITDARNTQGLIIDNTKKDHEYWSLFTPNEEQLAAGYTGDKLYQEWQAGQKQYESDKSFNIDAGALELENLKKDRDAYLAEQEEKRKQAQSEESFWDSLGRWLGTTPDTTIPLAGVSGTSNSGSTTTKFDARITELEEQIKRAKYVQGYEGFMSNINAVDFNAGSQYDSTRTETPMEDAIWGIGSNQQYDTGKLFGDFLYDYINKNQDALDAATVNDTASSAYFMGLDKGFLQTMTDDEIKVYNYLYNTQGKESANEFLSFIGSDLKGRKRQQEQAFWAAYAKENPVASSVFSTLISPLKGFSYLGQAADMLDDGKMEENAGYNRFSEIPSAIRSQVSTTIEKSGKWGKVGSFAYNTGMSMADFVFTTAVSGGNQALSLAIMGTGAAADATIAAKNRGLDDGEAFTLGTIAGLAEVAMEKISLGAWLEGDMTEGALKYMLKNALSEGGEEASTSVINLLADVIIAGDKSEWNMAMQAYIDQGKSPEEAFGLVAAEQAAQIGLDALGGVLSGGVIGGGTYVGSSIGAGIQYGNDGKNKEFAQELVTEGLQLAPNNQYIQKMQGKLDKGKTLTGMQVRNILAANQEQITTNDMKKIQKAAEKRLTELGQTEDVSRLAELATRYATGQELTRAEKRLLASSQYGSRVANELLPENIDSEGYSTAWAEEIGTRSVNAKSYNKKAIRTILDAMASAEDPNAYKSLGDRVGTESSFTVSESGQATIRDTDEAISLDDVEVLDIGEGDISLRVDGKEVKASEIDFADESQSYLFEAVSKIEHITPGAATAIIRDYNPTTGQTVGEYLNGIDEGYTYGYYGYSEADLKAGTFATKLTDEQMMSAYRLGQSARKISDTSKIEAIKRMRTAEDVAVSKKETTTKQKAKNLTVTYNKGGGKVVDIDKAGIKDAKRSGAVEVAKILHKMGLGTRIEFFSSYLTTDDNGNKIRVFLDDNGVEQRAYSGVYRKSDGTIRIDLEAYNGRGLTLNALSHELTHFIQQWSDEKYKALADFLIKAYESTDMTMHERVLREQKRLENIRGKEVSYDEAFDEVVANAMSKMFDDGNLVERLTELRAEDESLARKLWEGFKKIMSKFLGIYENESALFKDAADLVEMKETFEQIQNMFAEALVEASENHQATFTAAESQTLTEAGIGFDEDTKSVYSLHFSTAYQDTIQVGKKSFDTEAIAQLVAKGTGRSIEDARKWVQSELTIANIVMQNPEFLDYEADSRYDAIKKNSDYPQGTVDLSNLCPKRVEFTAMFDMLQKKYPNKLFTADTVAEMRKILAKNKVTVACGACFVEDRRQLIGEIADTFIGMWKEAVDSGKPLQKTNAAGEKIELLVTKALAKQYGLTPGAKIMATDTYIPNQYDLTTYEGFKQLEKNHPTIAMSFNRYNNSRGQQSARLIEGRAEYNRQILGWSDAKVRSVNNNGGLRIFSFSDFEVVHLLDLVQVIIDCAAKGVKIQGYTKIPAFAKLVRGTGIKLNRSLIPKGDYGYHMENGKVVLDYDPVEGIDINDENFIDESNNPDVGNIVIGINPTQIGAAMLEPFIDYIIPFHTNKAKDILKKLGTGEWVNYKESQHEKDISTGKASKHNVNIYTEVINKYHPKNKVEFVEAFLAECKRQGKIPRYAEFLNVDANGDYAYREGYHKLLVDFKMFDADGNILPQGNITPNLNDGFMADLLNAEVDRKKNYEFPQKVYDDIEKKFGEQYSSQETDLDTKAHPYSYDTLVSKPDMVVTEVDGNVPSNRADVVYQAKQNAAKVGKTDPKTGSVSVRVDDIGIDVILGTDGLKHGLRRTKDAQNDANYIVTLKAGEIIKHSIKVNEMTPKKVDAKESLVLIGVARNLNGDTYVVRSVVNRFSNALTSIDVLYAINAKKEELAATKSPRFTAEPLSVTSSTISIANLLDLVNQYFPDVLPEDVLKHYGHDARPEGDLGGDMLYSSHETETDLAPTFYNQMGKVVDGMKQEKFGASSVISMLRGRGVKAEEIRWSGIQAFLDGKKSVTKAELLEFINGSMLQIEEQEMSGGGKPELWDDFYRQMKDVIPYFSMEEIEEMCFDYDGDFSAEKFESELREYVEDGTISEDDFDEATEYAEEMGESLKNASGTQWSKYKLDGGENYREILFKMPGSEYSNRAMEDHWGDNAKGILAHARIQDFNTFIGRMLFIEEIQSDWHNQGRKKGYETGEMASLIEKRTSLMRELMSIGDDNVAAKKELERQYNAVARRIYELGNDKGRKVPDAPFRDNYHEYVLKRLIRMAAEQGYDSIGWTTADIQSERWSNDYAEGYRIEYDQDIPKFLKKYAKQWGSTVGKTVLDNGTEVWSMAITDSMQRSVLEEGQAMYSEHDTDSVSNRHLLANAFEGITQNSVEYGMIQEYKSSIALLNELEAKLDKLNAEIREIRFGTTGVRDTARLAQLEAEARNTAQAINRQDKKLLSLEASEPLRRVIAHERKKEAIKTKEHVREIQQNKRARAEQTELRHKIRKAIRDLDKLLNRGNKKLNVKEDLQPVVTKALQAAEILFTDNYGTYDMLRNGLGVDLSDAEEALVKTCTKMLSDLDKMPTDSYEGWQARQEAENRLRIKMSKLNDVFARERKRLNNTTVSSILGELADAYAKLNDSAMGYVQGAYSEPVHNFLKNLQSEVGGTIVKDMTKEQLEHVYAAYRMVLETVRNANRMFNEELRQSREQLGNAVIEEVREAGGVHLLGTKLGDAISQFDWNNLKPVWAGDRIGSSTFGKLMRGLFKGQYSFAKDIDEVRRFKLAMDKKYKPRSWDAEKLYEFESSTGKKFSLNLQQIMSLYAFSKREQAYSHLISGGFVFEENSTVIVEKNGIKRTYIHKGAASYKLNVATLNRIINSLTAEQKAYVDEMQTFLSDVMGAKGNEVSMKLYGIQMFKEKFYFPLRSSGAYMERAKEAEMKKEQGQINLVNSGFTHAVKPEAKNPIVLSGFMDVWAEHCNEMSMYHSMVLPMEDFRKVYNYTTVHDEKMESASVYQTIQDAYGKAATNYIDQLYRELNAGATVDPRETPYKKLISNFKRSAVMLSFSVVVQQFSSVGRAWAVINPKYFTGTKVNSDTKLSAVEEMKKYAPVAIIKEMGGFDTGTKGNAKAFIMAEQYGKGERFQGFVKDEQYRGDIMGILPAKADEKTWIAIWEAAKRETKANNPKMDVKSEEFLKLAGERFSEVIEKTQVYDSVLARSANMRSKGGLMQMATAFMAEPTTTVNLLENAVRNGDKKQIASAFGAVAVSIVLNNALASIVYAMRDDDEDETLLEKYSQSFFSGLIDDINPMSYYPFLKDVYSLFQGYDVERTDMSVIADVRDALKKAVSLLGKDTSDMDDEELAAHYKQVNEVFMGILDAGCSAFGVPVKNIRRDASGLINAFVTAQKDITERDNSWLSFWDKVGSAVKDTIPVLAWTKDKAKTDKLYDAIVSGDKAYLYRLKSTYKTDSAYQSAVRKALRENDSRIQEAAQARYDGNTEEYKRIFKEIQNEGRFSFDDIMSAINSEESKLQPDKETSRYGASDFVEAIILGDPTNAQAMKEDIIATKVANGKTQEEAEEEFANAVSTSIGDAYTSGLLDEAGAEKMLQEYAGKDEEEAVSKVSYWAFGVENPEYDYFTEANVKDYREWAEPTGISLNVFTQFINGTKGLADIKDEWGDVEVSKREQVLDVINALPLTWQQKDALYLAAGYAESKIWDVPW